MSEHHFTVEQRVQRFRRFYRRENRRPLFGFFMGSEYPLFRYQSAATLPVERPLAPGDFDVDRYVDDSVELFERHEACGGDFIWSASAFWGIPWVEAALGCPIHADPNTGSAHSRPPAAFHGADDIPEFDPDGPWAQKLVEFIDALAARSQGAWPIGTTRMRGIADLLAAFYGGERFVFAMMEQPDEVKEVCRRLTDFWIAMGRLQLQRIPPFHGGVGSFYYNMWAPAGTIWHQEDAAALLSPSLYGEFIEPCDRRIADAFPGCIIHQHPAGYTPVDAYLAMDMTALELHIDAGGPSAEELFDVHAKILAQKPLLIWGNLSEGDLDWIFAKLPPQGLAVETVVDTPDEAAALWRHYMGTAPRMPDEPLYSDTLEET